MISLRKHMEEHREELLNTTLSCCRDVIAAIAQSGSRVCPTLADQFRDNLLRLREQLSLEEGAEGVSRTGQQIEKELDGWGDQACQYYREKAGEIRELMIAITEAAQAVGERDERYGAQFRGVSEQLRQIGDLEDLGRIRRLVQASAGQLRAAAEGMAAEGQQSVARLQMQLAVYQEKLADAERASATDPLTGLANRAGIEHEIEGRIKVGRSFCLMMADLNGFKAINDTYGHAAGDHVLRSFAIEFRAQFRPLDPVGRWGGDEFVVVLDCGMAEAQERADRVRKWALGEYALADGPSAKKAQVGAAIGIAKWSPGQTAAELFEEADRAMYRNKKAR